MTTAIGLLGGLLVVVGVVWRFRDAQSREATERMFNRRRNARLRKSSQGGKLRWGVKPEASKLAEANPALASASTVMAETPRRSDRVLLKIPLDVSGNDLEGRPFSERTHTLVVNRNGASVLLQNAVAAEAHLTVKNLQTGQTCTFRVCESGPNLPGGIREWGVECADPAPNFWGINFPDAPEDPEEETVGSLLECTGCHCREMTRLLLSDYRAIVKDTFSIRYCSWCGNDTEWKFAIVEEDHGATALPTLRPVKGGESKPPDEEKRRDDRRIAKLPISIRHEDGREEFTITENVSRSGVCCAATMQLAAGDQVFLSLISDHGPGEVEFRAEVRWCRRINEKRGFLYGMKMTRD